MNLWLKSFLCFCQCWELISHYLFKDCFCSILSLPYFQSSDMCQTLVELPGGTLGKEPTCQCKSHKTHGFNPWVKKIPGRRRYQPIPVFLPREFHGQKSLEGYSPWGCTVGHIYTYSQYMFCRSRFISPAYTKTFCFINPNVG